MKVLVAGATGVVGRQLVPLLHQRGDEVVAMVRSFPSTPTNGVSTVSVDALDERAVGDVVRRVRPDAVVNLLSAIPKELQPRRFASQMARTNRLRTRGTANLARAIRGSAPLVTASVAFLYRPAGAAVADESQSLWTDGPRSTHDVVRAISVAEHQTLAVRGTVLRLGHLYGPGTHLAADGSLTDQVRRGRVPYVTRAQSSFSFAHVHDVALAFRAALDEPGAGVVNVVDDDPAAIGDWLPQLATLLGAKPPGQVPGSVARVLGGSWGHAWMTSLVGASNTRARERLGWRPVRSSWRDGFADELGGQRSASTTAGTES